MQAEIEAQMKLQKNNNYLERIALFRRERELLDLMTKPGLAYADPIRKDQGHTAD